jgi:hypothetical protein
MYKARAMDKCTSGLREVLKKRRRNNGTRSFGCFSGFSGSSAMFAALGNMVLGIRASVWESLGSVCTTFLDLGGVLFL